jgi:hypothetical protein
MISMEEMARQAVRLTVEIAQKDELIAELEDKVNDLEFSLMDMRSAG